MGNEEAVGFVVGSGNTFWKPFVDWLQFPFPSDPVDSFTASVVERIMEENFSHMNYEIRYDYHYPPNPKFVHVQTAAHVSGAAHYDQDVMWCVHAKYGVWCVFRAVIIFPDLVWEGPVPTPPKSLLTQEEKNEILRLSDIADDENWKNHETLLLIRDAVNHGKQEYRYTGHQLDYFYPIVYTKRQVLLDAKYEQESNPAALRGWTESTSFTGKRASHACVRVGDKVYVLGGYGYEDDSATQMKYLSDVQFATIHPDGTLSEWKQTTKFDIPRAGHSCVANEGIIYVIGGWADDGYLSDVQCATVAEDGSIDKWTKLPGLPRSQSHHSSFVFKTPLRTFIYAVGGICEVGKHSVRLDDGLFCRVNSDGSLGEWKACAFHMKGGRSSPACYVWNNTLFVSGGWGDNVDDIYSDVQYTALRLDGEFSPWRTSPYRLKVGVYGHSVIVSNGRAICLGGNGGQGNIFDTVAVTTLNESGPREWFWNRFFLPSPVWGHQIIEHGNYVYLLGGYNKQGPISSVFFVQDRESSIKDNYESGC